MPDDHENASLLSLDDATRKNVTTWLSQDYDVATKEEIRRLLKNSPRELTDAFYTTLEFGTGGLRGLTGVGCNRMNRYTVQYATQGLANYLKSQFKKASEPLKVAISFDSRLSSNEFAEETAKVLAGNGIQVFLFKELRPTPVLSFACRHKKCHAAIMVTASHNPSNYNGYKVYWNDGAQVVFPHDKGIIKEVQQVKAPTQVHLAPMNSPLISYLDESLDEAYLNALAALQIYPKECQKLGGALKVIYSNLHGTGITVLPKLLERFGITNLSFVEEQKKPDGSFPTVKSPNPEEREALQLGIKQMEREKADLLIATDPDADRVAAVVMHDGQPAIIDGNQMACLLLEHVLEGLSSKGKLPKNGAAVKSLVTSELFGRIAAAYQVPCLNVLTGFKYIAEKIREWEQTGAHQFLFGGEESYGYLFGTNSRDKDAIISATLIAEMAALAKAKGQTLVDRL
ncbi:MAG: pgm, partial [Chlamydiales bacterium]|nr:pgm [Chlamydiales bacterium]